VPVDWEKALDFKQASKNLGDEKVGDWHQDPWGWPEVEFAIKKNPSAILDTCRGAGSRQAALIDIPKENWGSRPAVVLDIMDRLVYQAMVDRLSLNLIGDMSPNAFGWRMPATEPKRGIYSHNNEQWEWYRAHLSTLASGYEVCLKTDLVSFFASIPVPQLQETIQDRTPKGAITDRLCDLLGGFASIPGRSGLPQRSWASAILANMYIGPLDDALTHFAEPLPVPVTSKLQYHGFARWMDDIWLFGHDPAAMRKAQVGLQGIARTLGLNLNAAKTDVLEGDEVARQALEVEHSAVVDALEPILGEPNFQPLQELLDRLLEKPEKASRTSVRFATLRMRQHESDYRAQDLIQSARRMPHVADALSRLFRLTFTQESLEEWFLDYARSDWATHQWAIAHYGRMFKSDRKPGSGLIDFFANKVRDANTELPLLAVAAQRLVAWDASEARSAFRDAFPKMSTAHARRVLALTALSAGERRGTVRTWLSADAENAPTLLMLEDASFVPPRVESDFSG
jgi:hypothetical protein